MNYSDWYTDSMDIYRTMKTVVGGITKQVLPPVPTYSGIPCRIYQSKLPPITMKLPAAYVQSDNKLMCDISADIRKGDVLMVKRNKTVTKYFVGDIQDYTEPFGSVLPGLSHKEASIYMEVRT